MPTTPNDPDQNPLDRVPAFGGRPKRTRALLLVLSLVLTVGITILFCRGLLAALRPEPRPTPAGMASLSQLFLQSSDFPDGLWIPDPPEPREACSSTPLGSGCESAEALSLFFYRLGTRSGSTLQTIHVYYTEQDAAVDFQRVVDLELQDGHPMRTSWAHPPQWDPTAVSTDQATLKCRIPWPGEPSECEYIGRYKEFIVILHSRVDSLDLLELMQVIRALDARITSALPASDESQLLGE